MGKRCAQGGGDDAGAADGNGHQVEGLGGWLAGPPRVVRLEGTRRCKKRDCDGGYARRVGWAWMRESWIVAGVRNEALTLLVVLTECQEWEWVGLRPGGVWIWTGLGVAWPRLAR
jgi:hypothetical protein